MDVLGDLVYNFVSNKINLAIIYTDYKNFQNYSATKILTNE